MTTLQVPPAYLRDREEPRTDQCNVHRPFILLCPKNGRHCKSFVSMEICKGVNMDLCRGAAAPSKHHTLMPVVEFNKLER